MSSTAAIESTFSFFAESFREPGCHAAKLQQMNHREGTPSLNCSVRPWPMCAERFVVSWASRAAQPRGSDQVSWMQPLCTPRSVNSVDKGILVVLIGVAEYLLASCAPHGHLAGVHVQIFCQLSLNTTQPSRIWFLCDCLRRYADNCHVKTTQMLTIRCVRTWRRRLCLGNHGSL